MQSTIQNIRNELKNHYPDQEIAGFIRIIFLHIFNLSPNEIILHKNYLPDSDQKSKIDHIISRLKRFEPIQYILGETEFYGLKLQVNPSVLIPRPETEELVDWIIKSGISQNVSILDIGTGSGCIALALKKNLPLADVQGFDVSGKALETAKNNALLLNLKINFEQRDIFDVGNIRVQFDLIVSNPPYVRESEKSWIHPNVLDHEPKEALFVSDEDPLKFYRAIIKCSENNLKKGGRIYFEINEAMGNEIFNLLKKSGYSEIEIRNDLNGKVRMVRCRK